MPIEQKITDPATGEVMSKSFFSVVFVGSQLKSRIFRTCTTFNATRYTVPNTHTEIKQALSALDDGIAESRAVLQRTTDEITTLLRSIIQDASSRRSPLADWLYLIGKEKAISDALRKCDLSNPRAKTIRAEGWVPTEDIERLRASLSHPGSGREQAVMQIVVTQKPRPTYFKTNKITETFQSIVDTYGIARYQEVNPGMFAIVTFPFLFGVMYGDIGHGILLTLMSGYILLKEKYYQEELRAKRITDEIFKMVFGGRYLIFMMGLFAIYCGTIYNDCMSIPTNVFGTHWKSTLPGAAYSWDGGVYPYGVDPSWYHTSNELAFMNSLKMKMAVTIGVVHVCQPFARILLACVHRTNPLIFVV
jgi:V-type H+-transporting ATPase subunit a